jgi:hypothetical protein
MTDTGARNGVSCHCLWSAKTPSVRSEKIHSDVTLLGEDFITTTSDVRPDFTHPILLNIHLILHQAAGLLLPAALLRPSRPTGSPLLGIFLFLSLSLGLFRDDFELLAGTTARLLDSSTQPRCAIVRTCAIRKKVDHFGWPIGQKYLSRLLISV